MSHRKYMLHLIFCQARFDEETGESGTNPLFFNRIHVERICQMAANRLDSVAVKALEMRLTWSKLADY